MFGRNCKKLTRCSVSRRIAIFTKDPQIWKQMYYAYFIYVRFANPAKYDAIRRKSPDSLYSMFDKMAGMDWKSKFRLRYRWSKGTCTRREVVLASKTLPETFLSLCGSMAITADVECGLRAWSMRRKQHTLIATGRLTVGDDYHHLQPTALSVQIDVRSLEKLLIAVGFHRGVIGVYTFDCSAKSFAPQQIFSCFDHHAVSSLSQAGLGYMLAMSSTHALSLFKLDWNKEDEEPVLVYSLKSQSDWTPVSVSLRTSSTLLMASITYVFPRFVSGWSVGLQELRWNPQSHELLSSRLATAPQHGDASLGSNSRMMFKNPYLPPTTTKPTSLCYTHPYLLATHPDNTLSLYMVRSTDSELSISPGKRLWGHTSDIHAANIGDRGKAVTVAQGGDIRVWELEEGLTSAAARKATPGPMVSVKLRHAPVEGNPETIRQVQLTANINPDDVYIGNTLPIAVDFDEERLIVLRKKGSIAQQLLVYDFT